MDLPTQSHLKMLRDLLRFRLGELRADVHAAEMQRQAVAEGGGVEVADRKDEASRDQLSTLSGQEEARDRDELREVEAALRRLDLEAYGDCGVCGEPIPLQRLLVQPTARRCAACQANAEAVTARSA